MAQLGKHTVRVHEPSTSSFYVFCAMQKMIQLNGRTEFFSGINSISAEFVFHFMLDILKEQDLYILLGIIKSARPQWKQIGLALGFPYDELTTIEQKPLLIPEGSTGYITEMLNLWLKWAPSKHEYPTLTALAIALRKSGQETIAATLREQFNQQKGIIMCVYVPNLYTMYR